MLSRGSEKINCPNWSRNTTIEWVKTLKNKLCPSQNLCTVSLRFCWNIKWQIVMEFLSCFCSFPSVAQELSRKYERAAHVQPHWRLICEAQNALSPGFSRTPMGFPLSSTEMMISNAASSPTPTRQLKGRQETTGREEIEHLKMWYFQEHFPQLVMKAVTMLTSLEISYLKYSYQELWVLWE